MKGSSVKNYLRLSKHAESKKRLETKTAHKRDIVAAYSELHLRGEMLPENQQVFQIKVAKTFL